MDRRAFVTMTGGCVVAASLAAQAQQAGKTYRIGFLGAEGASTNLYFREAFRLGMREHDYAETKNLRIEVRWAEGRNERFPELAAELIRLNLDVIVTISTPAARAAKALSPKLPIVFV